MSDPVWFTYATESHGACNPLIILQPQPRYMEISNMPRIVTDWCQQYALIKRNSYRYSSKVSLDHN